MKILITGFAGMIGSNLTKALLEEGHEVIGIDNFWRGSMDNIKLAGVPTNHLKHLTVIEADLAAPGAWSDCFNSIDIVIHLADIVAGCSYVFNNEGSVFRQNLLINSNVASAVEKAKPKRYIYIGTACSFPKELQTGVDAKPLEETDQLPASPESGYGWSKLMGELDTEYLEKAGITSTVTLILHNVYGWPCEYKTERAQVIPSLCYKALVSKDQVLHVWGDGSQGRAFVHVSDVVKAILTILHRPSVSGKIMIGPSICTPIKEIAEALIEITPELKSISYQLDKPVGDRGRCANYSKAKSLLDWEPQVGIKEGVQMLIDCIRADIG